VADLRREVQSGDRVRALKALRDYLARALEETNSGRDRAALARQLTLVLNELERSDVETSDRFAELTKDFEW